MLVAALCLPACLSPQLPAASQQQCLGGALQGGALSSVPWTARAPVPSSPAFC